MVLNCLILGKIDKMKRILAVVFLAAVLYVAYLFFFTGARHASGPKPQAIRVQKHSALFNQRISATLDRYVQLRDVLVTGDSMAIRGATQPFLSVLDSLDLGELKADDSTIFMTAKQQLSDIRANAQDILLQTDPHEMREDFRMVSENVYPFLKTVGYEGPRLYWITCPSAFGADLEGSWINRSREIVNPYAARPQDKNCGEINDSL